MTRQFEFVAMEAGRIYAFLEESPVDVFDFRGQYIDNFYLEFPSGIEPLGFLLGQIVMKDGFLYSVDQDAEGYFSIAKYEISDSGKLPIR